MGKRGASATGECELRTGRESSLEPPGKRHLLTVGLWTSGLFREALILGHLLQHT